MVDFGGIRGAPAGHRARDRGVSLVEWGASLLLVAGIVAVLVSVTGVPRQVSVGVRSAICTVFQGGGCGPGSSGSDSGGSGGGQEPLSRQVPGGNHNGQPTTLPTPGQAPPPEPPREPSPSPGPPVPQPPPSQERLDTERVLNETPLGRDALQFARDNNVTVVYRPGGGSYYNRRTNTIYIDSSRTPEDMAGIFIHEVNHARNRDHPDPNDMGREEYIDAAIDEEVDGEVLEIQNNQQLEQARGRPLPNVGLQREYEDAYENAINQARQGRAQQGQPPLSPEEERRIGEAAGRQVIEEAIESGRIVRTSDGRTYRENYGEAWDDAHNCFLWFC
jgi:hypothetical protein